MRMVNVGKDKALAFILGLVYGYRKADFELKILKLEDFREENHLKDRVYYINRHRGEVYDCFTEGTTHVCVIREDEVNRKVWLFVYKKSR